MTMILKKMKEAFSRSMPLTVRHWIWFLTDQEYRTKYSQTQKRIAALRAARCEAGASILAQQGSIVQSGPFRGMDYFPRLGSTIPTSKILGTYEQELWTVLEHIGRSGYTSIVDIGAAEGYYVVGLALRFPAAVRIVAFEAQSSLHPQIEDLANRNGVRNRIAIHGRCDSSSLKSVLTDGGRGALVICDIEGAEEHVLDPMAVPALQQTDILVEVHEHLAPKISELLRSRFQATHHIEEIFSVARRVCDCPQSVKLADELAVQAMDESRDPQSKWYWMTTKNR